MQACRQLVDQIQAECTQRWTLMEVCGGQTHALLRHGIDQLLAPWVELIHGPGCPVCVTSSERIDQALVLAKQPDVILCSYGDMLRVPGTDGRDLLRLRSQGADVRVLYSPLDALAIAQENPRKQVVFFAVGFETTAPATALLAQQAFASGLPNLKLLLAHVRVAPVLDPLLAEPHCAVQGLLAAGHVCAVMGEAEYVELAERHRLPIVITGFSPEALLQGILHCVRQLEQGRHELENAYSSVALAAGNRPAQQLIDAVFEPVDTIWRGLGMIPQGGYQLREPFSALALAPPQQQLRAPCPEICPSARVLQGLMRPSDCQSFGEACTPEHPLGAPMVSSEGACAAYFRYPR
ncbi:MAG: hydrogenase formation protein HypD [Vulcanococcus sp.]